MSTPKPILLIGGIRGTGSLIARLLRRQGNRARVDPVESDHPGRGRGHHEAEDAWTRNRGGRATSSSPPDAEAAIRF